MKPLFAILLLGVAIGCTKHKKVDFKPYEGPVLEVEDLEFQYSDSAVLKVKGNAKKRLEFLNGNQEFPKGLYLEFFDETGQRTSYLKANNATFYAEENRWRARENVEVFNYENKEQLNTDELFWYPNKELIKTEKFVTIKTAENIIHGRGLSAKQDFSYHRIKNIEGIIKIEDN